jgi:hypothetical protein
VPNAFLDLFHKEVLPDWSAMIGGIGGGARILTGDGRLGGRGLRDVSIAMLYQGKAVPICVRDAPGRSMKALEEWSVIGNGEDEKARWS